MLTRGRSCGWCCATHTSEALETLLKGFLKSIWTKTIPALASRAERSACLLASETPRTPTPSWSNFSEGLMSGHAARADRAATRAQTSSMAVGRMLLDGAFPIRLRRLSRSAGRWGRRPLTIAFTSWRRNDKAAALSLLPLARARMSNRMGSQLSPSEGCIGPTEGGSCALQAGLHQLLAVGGVLGRV
jgi:hypothetical protein